MSDHHAGELAYIDGFGGLVPCTVKAVLVPNTRDVTSGDITVRVNKTMGGYQRGEVLTGCKGYSIIPRSKHYYRAGHGRIRTDYVWQPDPGVISILSGFVRVATAGTWAEAQAILRAQIAGLYGTASGGLAADHRARELAMVEAGPDHNMIVTNGDWTFMDTLRCAQAGEHGLTGGDLAILTDYTRQLPRRTWTISVKCKILDVSAAGYARVRVTGESVQFTRNEVLDRVPVSALRTRKA